MIFVINSLDKIGGSETAIKYYAKKKNAKILTLDSIGANTRNLALDLLKTWKHLRKKNVNAWLEYSSIICLILRKIKIIDSLTIWIRCDVSHRFGRRNEILYKLFIGEADNYYFQSEDQRKKFLIKFSKVDRLKCKIIDYVPEYPIFQHKNRINKEAYMYAGRLVSDKNVIQIILWAIKNDKRLYIYGYGDLEADIIKYQNKHSEIIFYMGPYKSFFDLPNYGKLIIYSNAEGIPNVLFEAIHCNLTVYTKVYNEKISAIINTEKNVFSINSLDDIPLNGHQNNID